jgi:ABC-type uncharacterized transport system ATPase subunit
MISLREGDEKKKKNDEKVEFVLRMTHEMNGWKAIRTRILLIKKGSGAINKTLKQHTV